MSNNNNPKHGQNPNAGHQNKDQKHGQAGQHQGQHGQQKQGQAGQQQPDQKKNGWCAAHKGPKGKCNCE